MVHFSVFFKQEPISGDQDNVVIVFLAGSEMRHVQVSTATNYFMHEDLPWC